MARTESRRWRDWRVSDASGKSIRTDDNRSSGARTSKKRRARNGWWWTLSGREVDCHGCGKHLLAREKIAYNHQTRKIFCPDCARAECVSEMCKPSRKLLAVSS
jgi:ribosomal protein S27E